MFLLLELLLTTVINMCIDLLFVYFKNNVLGSTDSVLSFYSQICVKCRDNPVINCMFDISYFHTITDYGDLYLATASFNLSTLYIWGACIIGSLCIQNTHAKGH